MKPPLTRTSMIVHIHRLQMREVEKKLPQKEKTIMEFEEPAPEAWGK